MAIHYPQAWVVVHLLLDRLGQGEQAGLIRFDGAPISFTVTKNRWSEADEFEVEYDAEDFPIDPGVVRGATVELYVADAGGIDPGFFTSQSPAAARELCLIMGPADEVRTTFNDQARRFRLKGRDATAYFLDAEAEPGDVLYKKHGRKLSLFEVIEALVRQRDTTRKLRVVVEGQIPTTYPFDYKTAETRKIRGGETIWEIVQEMALEAGLVVSVDLDEIVLREPSTIFTLDSRLPFLNRDLRWTLGLDILEYEPERELGRQHGIVVKCAAWDPGEGFSDDGKTLVAFAKDGKRYDPKAPDPEDEPEALGPTTLGEEQRKQKKAVPLQSFVLRGMKDQDQLQRIAIQLSELLRHHERVARVVSHAMVDSQGKPLQRIRYGDPVFIDRAEGLLSNLLKSTPDQVEALAEIGWEKPDAEALREAIARLEQPLYVDTVKYRYDSAAEQAFSIEFTVRARREVAA